MFLEETLKAKAFLEEMTEAETGVMQIAAKECLETTLSPHTSYCLPRSHKGPPVKT